jgi:DNA mismatch repair protein MutS2
VPPRYDLDTLELDAVRQLLLARLTTPLGRSAVDALAPAPDAAEANRRLQIAADLAARAQRGESPPFAGVVEVRSWLAAFYANEHTPDTKELAELKRLLRAASRCKTWLGDATSTPALAALAHTFPRTSDIAGEMDVVLDDRGEVLNTASPKLAKLRAEIEAAESEVHAAVRAFLGNESVRRYLQSPEPSWRHGRPTFQVRQEHRGRVPGVLHDRSASGQTLFIEPPVVVEAANRLSDARAAEQHEIQVVLAHILRGLRKVRADVEGAIAALVQLDLGTASARLIHQDGFLAAPVVETGPIRLRDARHPLLLGQKRSADVVPLELTLGDPYRLLVVTGPNTGGKTVTLKTVGLLAVMALCGVPIPAAAGTQIPFLDGVFVDIGDEQGIAQNLSTFSGHVRRIARCLRDASARSLVLLDELGAGTDPDEGGALGYAVLEALAARGTLAVVTTHLGRLKDFAYEKQGAENGSMAFDRQSLKPLYRLIVGVPGASHALDIATNVGMPEDIVARARVVLGKRARTVEEVVEKVVEARQHAEAERRRSTELVQQAEATERQAREKLNHAQVRGAWLEEEAAQMLDEELRAARQILEAPLKEFVNAPQPWAGKAKGLLEALVALFRGTSLHRRRMKFLGALRKDDVVYVPQLKRRCTVKKIDRVREMVSVEVGAMRLELPFDDVSWLQPLDERG